MPRIRCFLLEPTGRVEVRLRRYSANLSGCPTAASRDYHDASVVIGEEPQERDEQGYTTNGIKPVPAHDDPRWPTRCAACTYTFTEEDVWQRFTSAIYRRADTGEEMTLRTSEGGAPAGAMWYAPWMDGYCTPQDAHVLIVRTPGGDWTVDAQAQNCTLSADHKQEFHHCWVRHGTPPDIAVSKEGGSTCQAGAGSIQCGSYHGFLHHGWLED